MQQKLLFVRRTIILMPLPSTTGKARRFAVGLASGHDRRRATHA
jgi:hypothetical protein